MMPELVAHRGQMASYPENTLASIEAALACGARFIEFDVQCTKDKDLVVFHDVELGRVTGVKGNLFETTTGDLMQLRVTEPNRFPQGIFNEPVPMLSSVVSLLRRYPEVSAFVEIKEETIERLGVTAVVEQLSAELAPIHRQAIIISFHLETIAHIQQQGRHKTGWVLHNYDDRHRQQAQNLAPDYLIVNHTKLPDDQPLWPGDWQWMTYDIQDPELCIKYMNDVELIETGDICSMLKHPLFARGA